MGYEPNALLELKNKNATQVMGNPDDLNLRFARTLFALVGGNDCVFNEVLKKFFDGHNDLATLQLLR